jgi:hypothetical protein
MAAGCPRREDCWPRKRPSG